MKRRGPEPSRTFPPGPYPRPAAIRSLSDGLGFLQMQKLSALDAVGRGCTAVDATFPSFNPAEEKFDSVFLCEFWLKGEILLFWPTNDSCEQVP